MTSNIRGLIFVTDSPERSKMFGKEIQKRRRALGLSQKKLAQKAGITQPRISQIERLIEKSEMPADLRIEMILDHLEVEAAEDAEVAAK